MAERKEGENTTGRRGRRAGTGASTETQGSPDPNAVASQETTTAKPSVLDEARHSFNKALYGEGYDGNALKQALFDAQTVSFKSGDIHPSTIFDRLSVMATDALLTATERQDQEGIKSFTELQEGYEAALRMLSGVPVNRSTTPTPTRPMTSPKA